VILAPVAYAAAETGGVDVGMAFLAVAYGASCAFVLPFAHQCNLMIMGPGGYKTKDFVKVGSGLSIVMALTAIVLLSL
jgi:di/tricarboxylate transporter